MGIHLDPDERARIIARIRKWIKGVQGSYWLFDQKTAACQALHDVLDTKRSTAASWDYALQAELWAEAIK